MLQLQRKKSHKRHYRLTYALIAIGLIILLPSFVYAASVTKSNAADGAADGNEITRTVELTTSDFATGSTISTVTTTVEFAKIDAVDAGSCFTTGHQGGDPINREIYMYLTSPTGTQVDLIFNAPNFTYTDNSTYGGTATVVFDDAAATLVGGPAPSSGTFRPEEALSAFFGEDPLGTWTLTVGDSLQSAPVCFYDFSLTVTAEQAPVVEDQTFSVAENSPNDTVVDTIVANDSDPDDKLSYTVTGGTGQNVFDVDVLSGEITVSDDSQLTTTGSFTLNVTVMDSAALSDTAVITINVTNQNDAPVITEGTSTSVTMDEDGNPTAFSLTLNATDEEADDLTWTIKTQANNGTATTTSGVGNANVIGYTPTLNYNGNDLFVVQVSDGNGGLDEITVNVTINPQNDDPVAVDDGYTVNEDSSNNTLSVLSNDTNPDTGETLSISGIGATSNGGTANNNTTSISYSPAPGYVGTETFSYTLSDGNGRTDTATVTVTVNDVNEDPIITEGASTTVIMDEDSSPTAFSLTLNATDGDADTITWSIQSQGSLGTASASGTGSSKAIGYTPTANMNGSDSFVVQVSDGRSGTDTITVNVTINEQNDDPNAVDDSPSVNEQSSNNNLYPLVNDSISPDTGETLTITAVGPTDNGGTVSINANTSLIYTPTLSFIGTETFTYTISDGRTGTDTATIRVSVDDVNFSPVITEGTTTGVTIDEDNSPTAFSLTLNATDPDADTITWSLQSQASNGTATVSGTGASKTISYTPTANYNGSDSFMVRVTDGNGGVDAITVNVTINPINDDPVAANDSDSTPKDTAVIIDVLDNDTDPEDDSLSITAVTQGSKGIVSHNGSTVTYTPNLGESGPDTFTYTISDGTTGSDTGTVTVQLGVFELFVPLIANNFVSAPDLVVTSINASSDLIEIVIENQGTQATTSGFWVDFYIAPDPAPTHANELWSDVSSEGIVWGVDVAIPIGGSLTLSYSTTPGALNLYYSEANSSYSGVLPDGTSVYAQVDSAHLSTSYGGVLEIHEILSETYNNVSAEYIVGTVFRAENDLPEAAFVGQPLALPPR